MKRVGIAAALVCVALLSGACTTRTARMFVTAAEWEAWGGGQGLQKSIQAAARARGYSIGVEVVPTLDTAAGITRLLTRTRPPVVIASPLLSYDAYDAASKADAPAILMAGPEPAAGSRIVRIDFDRREAFTVMGRATGRALGESGGKAAILVPFSRWGGSAEIDAFTQGLSQGGYRDAPILRELPDPLDKVVVQNAVNELRRLGVEAFLPRLGELNEACMDALGASGGWMDTEDWRSSGVNPAQVFLSVEEDIAGGIGRGLEALGTDRRIVAGPAIVVCGKARPVPQEAMEGIECR